MNHPAATGTVLALGLVLGDHELDRRQLEDLAAFVARGPDLGEVSAAEADGEGMHHHLVWPFHRDQSVPLVPGLAPAVFSAFGAQAFRGGLGEAVDGGRFAAVAAVLGELAF